VRLGWSSVRAAACSPDADSYVNFPLEKTSFSTFLFQYTAGIPRSYTPVIYSRTIIVLLLLQYA
jgi:hypothetical protein